MRRRALLSALLAGGLAVLSGAFAVRPILDLPLDPDQGGEQEGSELPPSTEPTPPEPPPPGPEEEEEEEEEEERPPTEPA